MAADGPSQKPVTAGENAWEGTPWTSPRSLKQLSVFFVGATCFLASTAITRRAVYKRMLRVKPKYFSPNTNPHEHFSPFNDALMAMGLATMNCVSVGIMMVGGALWSVDISGVKELRDVTRKRLAYERIYADDEDDEDEDEDTAPESLEAAVIRKREEARQGNGPTTPR